MTPEQKLKWRDVPLVDNESPPVATLDAGVWA
jgi:hypothetical protein